jgi:hypothetical protein
MAKKSKTITLAAEEPDTDLHFWNVGTSIVMLQADTDAGADWIAENVQAEDWQGGCWGGIAAEPRYAGAILEGAAADGLRV